MSVETGSTSTAHPPALAHELQNLDGNSDSSPFENEVSAWTSQNHSSSSDDAATISLHTRDSSTVSNSTIGALPLSPTAQRTSFTHHSGSSAPRALPKLDRDSLQTLIRSSPVATALDQPTNWQNADWNKSPTASESGVLSEPRRSPATPSQKLDLLLDTVNLYKPPVRPRIDSITDRSSYVTDGSLASGSTCSTSPTDVASPINRKNSLVWFSPKQSWNNNQPLPLPKTRSIASSGHTTTAYSSHSNNSNLQRYRRTIRNKRVVSSPAAPLRVSFASSSPTYFSDYSDFSNPSDASTTGNTAVPQVPAKSKERLSITRLPSAPLHGSYSCTDLATPVIFSHTLTPLAPVPQRPVSLTLASKTHSDTDLLLTKDKFACDEIMLMEEKLKQQKMQEQKQQKLPVDAAAASALEPTKSGQSSFSGNYPPAKFASSRKVLSSASSNVSDERLAQAVLEGTPISLSRSSSTTSRVSKEIPSKSKRFSFLRLLKNKKAAQADSKSTTKRFGFQPFAVSKAPFTVSSKQRQGEEEAASSAVDQQTKKPSPDLGAAESAALLLPAVSSQSGDRDSKPWSLSSVLDNEVEKASKDAQVADLEKKIRGQQVSTNVLFLLFPISFSCARVGFWLF